MGALANYVDDLGPLARFYDFGIAETQIDAAADIASRNDPTAWVAYSTTALIEGWSALSGEARKEALEALFDILYRSLSGLADPAIKALAAGVSDLAGSLPIVAIIVELLKVVIGTFVKMSKATHGRNMKISRTYLAMVRKRFIETALEEPSAWVMETRSNPIRVKYLGYASSKTGPVAGKRFCKSPAWRPTTDQALMFLQTPPRTPTGECKPRNKFYVSCPFRNRDLYGEDCWKSNATKNSAKLCKSDVTISYLFYPWWSPGYPAGPMQIAFHDSGAVFIDPNKLMMARQLALLTDPESNLRVSGRRLRRITSTFIDWWTPRASGEMGLWPVDEEGNRVPSDDDTESLLIDDAFRKDWTGLVGEASLYYTRDGLIRSYDTGIDLTQWGVHSRASLGRGADGGDLAVTAAQYNTVVSMSLAFFTARSNMLRNGNLMARLVGRGKVGELDPDVRAAVRDAAEIGGTNIKLNVARFVGGKPKGGMVTDIKGRLRKGLTLKDLKGRFRDPGLAGGSGGAAAGILVVAGLGGLLYALTRK